MKKQIAVMMCAISFDNQRKILEGIMAGAKERDCNVFVFTNHVSYTEKELNKQGAFQILELPEFPLFDGVIFAGNTIQYKPAAEKLLENIRKSGVPVVSIDDDICGMNYIGISNYNAQRQVVEHIIHVHHKKRIAYVTGQLSKQSAQVRFRAYQDAMMEAGLPVDKRLIFRGNYDIDSGRNAVHSFHKQKEPMPEAIICANDNMAMGVLDQLRLYGYRVPEEIVVTGFDKDEMTEYHNPSITTVDAGQYVCGYQAVEMIFSGKKEDKQIVRTQMHIGGSCGCPIHGQHLENIRETYVESMQIVHQAADSIKNMTTEFAGMEQERDLVEALKKYVINSDMECFYLCRCKDEWTQNLGHGVPEEQVDIKSVNTDYTDVLSVALAYERGQFVLYDDIVKGEIVPQKAKGSGGNLFVISPIFYQNYCYGYCVSVNSYFPLKSELFFSWVLNIGIGLENIRKWNMLNATVNRLNSMWVYDMLTHVYNRAGFYHYAGKLLQSLQMENDIAGLLFVDIDGLKGVNDNLGHHKGDLFIKTIADCLKENLKDNQILMRYGGDEFVLFGKIESEEAFSQQISCIQRSIYKKNKSGQLEFTLGASIGNALYRAMEIEDLNEIIELADQKMYMEKREKKKKI